MQEKLNFLLEKYSIKKEAVLKGTDFVTVNQKQYPLLWWRSERRFVELRKLVKGSTLKGISVMRTLRIVNRGSDLYRELFRELDLAQYILGTKIMEIFAVGDPDHALNIIAKCTEGYLCTLEISATLSQGTKVIDKHEIIAASGVACDRVTDTQIPQHSIYVYGQGTEPETYTDVDAELFGLSVEECAIVRNAFDIAKTENDFSGESAGLSHLLECVNQSLKNVENVTVNRAI